jgi:hypothetical protein
MPYIKDSDRTEPLSLKLSEGMSIIMSREEIGQAMGEAMTCGGDFQYIVAAAIQRYLEKTGLRYQNCQDIMGALTGANAEFIRCIVSPYEAEKIAENGAVYDAEKMQAKGY